MESPYTKSTLLSKLFFTWPNSIIQTAKMKDDLMLSDLPAVPKEYNVFQLYEEFKAIWDNEVEHKKHISRFSKKEYAPSLMRVILIICWRKNAWIMIIVFIESIARIYQAVALGKFISFLLNTSSNSGSVYDNGYFISFLITLCGIIVTFSHHQFFFYAWGLGMQIRLIMTSAIYAKATRLHLRSLNGLPSGYGHVVNLCSQDVEAFQMAGTFFHFIYQPVIESLGVLYAGIATIGVSFLAGFAFIMLLLPLQAFFSQRLSHSRKVTSKHTDERIKLINQALTGVRLMKINGWELVFVDMIEKIRKFEIQALLKTNFLRAMNEAIFFVTPVLVGFFTFITYAKTGGVLSVEKVLTVLTLFNIMQMSMTKFFPFAIQFLSEAWVSTKRIQRVLLLDESVAIDRKSLDGNSSTDEGIDIKFENFYASWTAKSDSDESDSVVVSGYSKALITEVKVDDTKSAEEAAIDSNKDAASHNLRMTLSNINLSVARGELILVVGPVGSSKTSLLLAVLRELQGQSGRLNLSDSCLDRVAYCAQEAFILSSSVKENILFGQPYIESRFKEVIAACAMNHDLELFPHREHTIVGSKGINLSGGQRARLALARCLYADTDLYLLDDPLSAVDARVSNLLFNNAICQFLSTKTRILVTHQVQFLSSEHVTRIVVMDRGQISSCGSFHELQGTYSSDFFDAIFGTNSTNHEQAASDDIIDDKTRPDPAADVTATSIVGTNTKDALTKFKGASVRFDIGVKTRIVRDKAEADLSEPGTEYYYHDLGSQDSDSQVSEVAQEEDVLSQLKYEETKDSAEQVKAKEVARADEELEAIAKGITVAEDREIGVVRSSTFTNYFKSLGGMYAVILITVLLLAGQVLAVLANIWLAQWSRMSSSDQSNSSVINIYIVLVILTVFGAFLRSTVFFDYAIHAAESIHNAMLVCVLRAPVLFFDSNPHGRILNRFSRDVGVIDDNLPNTLYDFFQCVLMVLAAIVVVVIGTPYILIAIAPLCFYFVRLRSYFIKPSREIKRIESISRSPIFTHLSETMEGLLTIRSFKELDRFNRMMSNLINANGAAYFAFVAVSRWLGFRLDVIVVVLLMVSTFGAALAKEYNAGIQPVILAVGVMYVIQLSGLFQWSVRQSAEVENMMVSVERVSAYSAVPSEPPLHANPFSQDPSSAVHTKTAAESASNIDPQTFEIEKWPQHGKIVMNNLTCSYRKDLPPIIKGVSLVIEAGERVGIVGRTGSGKSTLISAILRLVDITEGVITIDDVDICSVGLHDIRPKISVIPQVPFLFSGTIRKNLDTLDQFTDLQIWHSVDSVGLRAAIDRLGGRGLDGVIEENGNNVSVGERQLFCLARSVLQKNVILILDEATSNVDMETDARIQSTIRREFLGSTVIMIAHRLQTVIDCDKIIVLSNGTVVEIGHPFELLSKYYTYTPEGLLNLAHTRVHESSAVEHGANRQRSADVDHDVRDSFAHMVNETGDSMSRYLMEQSSQSFNLKTSKSRDSLRNSEC